MEWNGLAELWLKYSVYVAIDFDECHKKVWTENKSNFLQKREIHIIVSNNNKEKRRRKRQEERSNLDGKKWKW